MSDNSATGDQQPENHEKPILFTCQDAIDYIKGLKKDDKDLPQEIEGAHISCRSLITQWDKYAIYKMVFVFETIQVVDLEKR